MGQHWEVDEILERALQEDDLDGMDSVIARLVAEEEMSRSAMLRRSFAAAAGLTILAHPRPRSHASSRGAAPPMRGTRDHLHRAREAGEEGGVDQHDRAAARLGELRRDHVDLQEEVRPQADERQPRRLVGAGEPGRALAQGRLARAGRPRRQPVLRDRRRERGPLREVLQPLLRERAARDEGRPRLLGRRLLGRDLVRRQPRRRLERAEVVERPAEAGVQEQGGAERQSADVGLRVRRRLLGRARERRLAEQHRPGDRLLQEAEGRRELHPGAGDAADDRLGTDADHDRLGLPQPGLRQGVPVGEDRRRDPDDRRVRGVLLPGDQRDGTAPVRGAALAGVPLLRRRAAALAEGLLAPRALHRHGAAEGRPGGAAEGAPFGGALREREVRRARRADARPRRSSRRTGRRRSGRSALESAIESEGVPRPARAGRGRPSLAWLGVVALLRLRDSSSSSCPPGRCSSARSRASTAASRSRTSRSS